MSWLFLLLCIPMIGICRHSANDPNCSSNGGGYVREMEKRSAVKAKKEVVRLTKLLDAPNPELYEVAQIEEVDGSANGVHLVIKAKYPHCKDCFYEGIKIMVFTNCTYKDAVMWKSIDPHFGDQKSRASKGLAPHPDARFPATSKGWDDAMRYAKQQA